MKIDAQTWREGANDIEDEYHALDLTELADDRFRPVLVTWHSCPFAIRTVIISGRLGRGEQLTRLTGSQLVGRRMLRKPRGPLQRASFTEPLCRVVDPRAGAFVNSGSFRGFATR